MCQCLWLDDDVFLIRAVTNYTLSASSLRFCFRLHWNLGENPIWLLL
jgi:hypothetical protein